jgi:hypothetical protein
MPGVIPDCRVDLRDSGICEELAELSLTDLFESP